MNQMPKQALFVGRFQPFHKGHVDVIKKALTKEDRMIIVIGSAEKNHEAENPFTASERFQMIETALQNEGIARDRYCIIPVRNIQNFILWTAHVDQYIPPVYKIYTGSPIVKELHRSYGKYEIEDIELLPGITGTAVRQKMLAGDDTWKEMVPAGVAALIEKWKGEERLKMISLFK